MKFMGIEIVQKFIMDLHKTGVKPEDILITTRDESKRNQLHFEKLQRRAREEGVDFLFVDTSALKDILNNLSLNTWGYFFLLIQKLRFKDFYNQMFIGTKRKKLNVLKIAELWNVKPDTAQRILKKLVKAEVMYYNKKQNAYYLKEDFIHKGRVRDKSIIQNAVKINAKAVLDLATDCYKSNQNTFAILGMLFQLVIFINKDSQFLVPNTKKIGLDCNEKHEEFFERLRIEGFEKISILNIQNLGITKDRKTIVKHLANLERLNVLAYDALLDCYVFNPLIANRQDTADYELLNYLLKRYPSFLDIEEKPSAKLQEYEGKSSENMDETNDIKASR